MSLFHSFPFLLVVILLSLAAVVTANVSSQAKTPIHMIQHLEPVSNFVLNIESVAEASQYKASDMPSRLNVQAMKSQAFTLSAENIQDRSAPYGEKISLSFEAFNEVFDYQLELDTSAFSSSARVNVVSESSSEYFSPRPNTYRATFVDQFGHQGTAVATVLDGGDSVDAVIFRDNEVYHVQPASRHLADVHASVTDAERVNRVASLSTSRRGRGLTVYKVSDLNDKDEQGNYFQACGSAAPTEVNAEPSVAGEEQPTAHFHVDSVASASRHLLLKRWENCFPTVNNGLKRIHIALAVDYGAYVAMGADAGLVTSRVASTFAQVNEIYKAQLGLVVTIGELTIMTSKGTHSWNHVGKGEPGSACPNINTLLSEFSNWRKTTYPANYAAVMLITNCFPSPGTVGLAWTGTTCGNFHSSGWANVMANQFLVVAHELAHILGGNHSFQNGVGKTGGILDYGNGKLLPSDSENPGEFGFHSTYSRHELCTHLSQAMRGANHLFSGNVRVPLANCYSDYEGSVCGNGVVEDGEECDVGVNGNACCSQCKLTSGSTCSVSSSCCVECKAVAATTACGKGRTSGFCSRGECHTSVCNGFGNASPCGFKEDNVCRERCLISDKCITLSNDPTIVPTGTYCPLASGVEGVCFASGSDIPVCVNKTYSWAIVGDFQECNCQGVQTKNLSCVENNVNVVANSFCEQSPLPESATQSCTKSETCA